MSLNDLMPCLPIRIPIVICHYIYRKLQIKGG